MATKGAKVGDKRKASAVHHNGTDKRVKKAAFEPKRKPFEEADGSDEANDFESFSDEEDGGAKLNDNKAGQKDYKKNDKFEANGKSQADNGKTFERGQNSRESHIKQKQLAQERKAAKPLADELHRTKKLWERLRRKSHVPKEERQKLVDELFEIITGRIKDFVLKHDAVRAVQTAIKYSTPIQRKQIAKELSGTYAQLAESRYAKFLIGKLLVQNDDEIRDLIVPEFYGKVRKLINHPEASWILDDIYRGVATKEQKAKLLREWYGPEFALFKDSGDGEVTGELSKILEAEPGKRGPIMKYLIDMVNQLVQKKLTGFTILHDAMLQYYLNVKPETEEHKEFLEMIKEDEGGDLLKNMAFTKSGARLSCLLLAYGSAKDRKQILKTYKDTFQLMCGDPYGHVVILTAYDVIDDTVLSSKAIFPEILGKNDQKEVENVIFCANDPFARTTIRYLFEGLSKTLFPPNLSSDLEILKEVHEIRKTTSKKDAETRRKELVTALSPQLLAAIAASPNELVSSSFGCQLVTDVLLDAVGDKTAALDAIAATAAGNPQPEDSKETYPPPMPHISQTPHGGRMFKTLIQGGRFDRESGQVKPVDPPLNFANILYPVIKDHIVAWATGSSSFVALALLESKSFSETEELRGNLRKNKKALKKAASEETAEQKAKREATEQADATKKTSGKGKKSAGKQERAVGNQGSKLLLEKI
ncbi:putative cpl domain-containing protein [Phaeoacremonium minimum UCRPA7]|uniref:Putative cpl domain-containing protein n=1 Tax=Phaeoacremonium minimum (strain UCR-PA7) TaxID=1286976 RepID=R8BBZ0_PHAM7|nr:putative cpl domain-containing protein [Phaeoacremonium minimum UCRPA7]EON96818.1 putative cpl domain-containing protein [Phaeoacremonium minimum UCRPA7]